MNKKSAISAINKAGILLVFPIDNKKEPASIWSHFYPKEKMLWEWDEDGDDRVSTLWHLRGDLSATGKVVYTKWFRSRATYFSRGVFTAMLRALNPHVNTSLEVRGSLSSEARRVLSVLESESPMSTKNLKKALSLKGRENERAYNKALLELWSRLLIVAWGEFDDGAFPSLGVGATSALFEELWSGAFSMPPAEAEKALAKALPKENLFYKHFLKLKNTKVPAKASSGVLKSEERATSLRREPVVSSVVRFEDL